MTTLLRITDSYAVNTDLILKVIFYKDNIYIEFKDRVASCKIELTEEEIKEIYDVFNTSTRMFIKVRSLIHGNILFINKDIVTRIHKLALHPTVCLINGENINVSNDYEYLIKRIS